MEKGQTSYIEEYKIHNIFTDNITTYVVVKIRMLKHYDMLNLEKNRSNNKRKLVIELLN